jgi:hypothetical protein
MVYHSVGLVALTDWTFKGKASGRVPEDPQAIVCGL